MIRTTLTISGMICGMCESHVNEAIRAAFSVKKVNSSRSKGETVILSQAPLDPEKLRRVIHATGYTMLAAKEEVQQKQSFFSALLRRKA